MRILLKLGRQDEAFEIVYKCLLEDPDFGDFEDIQESVEYTNWYASSGRLTDDEKAILKLSERLSAKIRKELDEAKNIDFKESIPTKKIMTYDEVIERFGQLYNIEYAPYLARYIVFEGDVAIKDDFDQEWLTKQYNDANNPRFGINYCNLSSSTEHSDELKKILKMTPLREGYYLKKFFDGSPLLKAGIQVGDVITHLGDVVVNNKNVIDDVKKDLKIGDSIKVGINRNGESMVFDVLLTPMQDLPCPKLGIIIDGHLKIEKDYVLGDYNDSAIYIHQKRDVM